MKVFSYNVMQGGFDEYSIDLKRPRRLNLIRKAVSEANADFVSLIDTYRWDSHFETNELRSLFGYRNVFCINLGDDRLKQIGHNNGITVMTNFDQVKFEKIQMHNRNAIKATVYAKGKECTFFCVYLDDLLETVRTSQIKSLKKQIDTASTTCLLGDLNCVETIHAKQVEANIKKHLTLSGGMQTVEINKVLGEILQGHTIEAIKDLGLRNASSQLRVTATTPISGLASKPFIQLDYAFVGDSLSVSNFEVIITDTTNKSSDHYPITFELDWA